MRWAVDLCYNVPGAPLYGELTPAGYRRVAEILAGAVENTTKICLFDAGSGSGNALSSLVLHLRRASQGSSRSMAAVGVEVDSIRCQLSRHVLAQSLPVDVPWKIVNQDILDILDMKTLGATHCYAFDKVFPPRVLRHLEELQRKSTNVVAVVTTKPKVYRANGWKLTGRTQASFRGGKGRCEFYAFQKP